MSNNLQRLLACFVVSFVVGGAARSIAIQAPTKTTEPAGNLERSSCTRLRGTTKERRRLHSRASLLTSTPTVYQIQQARRDPIAGKADTAIVRTVSGHK